MLEIRPATSADLPAVGRVHALSRNAAYAGLLPAEALARVTPERQEAVWRERFADAPARSALLVASDDGEVVGFTQGEYRDGVGHLNAIHLLPERRGGGAGQALHDALLEQFVAWGCVGATLFVRSSPLLQGVDWRWLAAGLGAVFSVLGLAVFFGVRAWREH